MQDLDMVNVCGLISDSKEVQSLKHSNNQIEMDQP